MLWLGRSSTKSWIKYAEKNFKPLSFCSGHLLQRSAAAMVVHQEQRISTLTLEVHFLAVHQELTVRLDTAVCSLQTLQDFNVAQ